MVDKITNTLSNLENKISKNSAKVKDSITKVNNYRNENSANIESIKIKQKSVVQDLASSAPIDHDKVSSIKQAISSGNYPLDLDKISDALMEAYNDMKS